MRGNFLGKMLSIASFGESHGFAVGVVIDGVPAGLSFCKESLAQLLAKRAPGGLGTSLRKENDVPQILSGIFEGKTLGTPIAVIVANEDCRSEDYEQLKEQCRVGHADRSTLLKYGIRDHRGGGRSSGRETIARVIGGYFALLILPQLEIELVIEKIAGLGDISQMAPYLESLRKKGESAGAKVRVVVKNPPVGLGEPVFDKLKADLAKAMLSIGGCTFFGYGLAEKFADLMGSQALEGHFGGIEGGISTGNPIEFVLAFKPPATVGEVAKQGRHDPCIIPRALPVIESMTRLTIADHYLRQNGYQIGRD